MFNFQLSFTDPVDELVRGVRHVVVDDVLDVGNVETAGRHGGGHQDLEPALGEVCEGLLPLPLGAVAVDAGRGHVLGRQVGGQVVSAGFLL